MRYLLFIFLTFTSVLATEKAIELLMETSEGTIEMKMMPDVAPKAVENFVTHAKKGYYNNGYFHRIIRNFMIQGGDPTGTGRGGKSIWNRGFAIEVRSEVTFDRAGLVAMAKRSTPNSQGSQFFITTGAVHQLDGDYTIFGEITPESMKVLRALANTPTKGDRPYTRPRIIKVWVKP